MSARPAVSEIKDPSHLPVWKGIDQPERLPGPPRLPLIGSMLSVGAPREFYNAMVRWLKQYGDPFYVPLGRFSYVFSANIDLARLILESRPEGARRPEMTQLAFASIDASEMLFSAEGRMWKAHRKAIAKSLGAHNLTVAESMIKAEVERQLHTLQQRIDKQPGQPVDFLPVAKHFSVSIIARLVFGSDFRNIATDDSVVDDIAVIFSTLARRISIPFPYWKVFKLPSDRRYDRIKAGLNADVLKAIEAARQKLAQQPASYRPETLLEGMLIDSGDPEDRLTDKHVIDNCIGLVAAGLDTTASTLSWSVFLLGQRPDIQERLHAELMAATQGTGDLSSLQGIQTLPLMEAVIWEALRLYPAAPFLPAQTLRDFEFEGQRIPAGTTFFFLLSEAEKASDRHDPSFNPDRWLAEGMLAKAIKQLPLPFGIGQRLCPGRNLSVMEMKAMLSALVQRYQWTVQKGFEPERYFNFTIDPSAVPVRFAKR